jgi:hypothetical protein
MVAHVERRASGYLVHSNAGGTACGRVVDARGLHSAAAARGRVQIDHALSSSVFADVYGLVGYKTAAAGKLVSKFGFSERRALVLHTQETAAWFKRDFSHYPYLA